MYNHYKNILLRKPQILDKDSPINAELQKQ